MVGEEGGGPLFFRKISGAPVSLARIELFGLVRVAKSGAETLASSHQTDEAELSEGQSRRKGTTTQKTDALADKSRRLATKLGWRLGAWEKGADLRSRRCVEVPPPFSLYGGFFCVCSVSNVFTCVPVFGSVFLFFLC